MSDNLIDIVKLAIKQEFHLVADDVTLLIEEKQPDAKCKFVEIKLKKSMYYFGFSLHKDREKGNNDPVYPFFNAQYEGICSKDDGILFLQKSNKVYVLLIEMKSTNTKGYLQQLKAAKSLLILFYNGLKFLTIKSIRKLNLEDYYFHVVAHQMREHIKKKNLHLKIETVY